MTITTGGRTYVIDETTPYERLLLIDEWARLLKSQGLVVRPELTVARLREIDRILQAGIVTVTDRSQP